MNLQRGDRVTLYLPGQPEDGWLGTVEAVDAMQVVVFLDQHHRYGRSLAFRPDQIRAETRADRDAPR